MRFVVFPCLICPVVCLLLWIQYTSIHINTQLPCDGDNGLRHIRPSNWQKFRLSLFLCPFISGAVESVNVYSMVNTMRWIYILVHIYIVAHIANRPLLREIECNPITANRHMIYFTCILPDSMPDSIKFAHIRTHMPQRVSWPLTSKASINCC